MFICFSSFLAMLVCSYITTFVLFIFHFISVHRNIVTLNCKVILAHQPLLWIYLNSFPQKICLMSMIEIWNKKIYPPFCHSYVLLLFYPCSTVALQLFETLLSILSFLIEDIHVYMCADLLACHYSNWPLLYHTIGGRSNCLSILFKFTLCLYTSHIVRLG